MAYGPITGRFVAIGSGSTATSSPWFVGDFRQITVSVQSSGSLGPSRFTIQGSNDDGFRAALGGPTSNTGWSLVTGIGPTQLAGPPAGSGIFTIDPGMRWLRVHIEPTTNSTASATTIVFQGRT